MKSLLLVSMVALLSSGQAYASGCDSNADGEPSIERIELKWAREYEATDLWMGCLDLRNGYCVPQLELRNESNIYRKELITGNDGAYLHSISISAAEWTELSEAHQAGKLIVKRIAENVYGRFDDNCAGPYPPLASGRYHLQLTHKETGKKWDFYFLHRLRYDLQLPLFK